MYRSLGTGDGEMAQIIITDLECWRLHVEVNARLKVSRGERFAFLITCQLSFKDDLFS